MTCLRSTPTFKGQLLLLSTCNKTSLSSSPSFKGQCLRQLSTTCQRRINIIDVFFKAQRSSAILDGSSCHCLPRHSIIIPVDAAVVHGNLSHGKRLHSFCAQAFSATFHCYEIFKIFVFLFLKTCAQWQSIETMAHFLYENFERESVGLAKF